MTHACIMVLLGLFVILIMLYALRKSLYLSCMLVIVTFGMSGWFAKTIPIPGTDATTGDAEDMIQECEKTLPRNQKCVIDLMVHPDDKH